MEGRKDFSYVAELPGDAPPARNVSDPMSLHKLDEKTLSGDKTNLEPSSSTTSFHISDAEGPRINDDGRIDIDFDSKLVRALSVLYKAPPNTEFDEAPPDYSESPSKGGENVFPLKLNIVIQVVGSRGDVQPFIALGHELRKHGHRIRIATHNIFDDFVRKSGSGLEFYPIGGNPSELMAYMVKNPGLIPSLKTIQAGEIKRKRIMVREMLEGCWRSCIEPDTLSNEPFVADAIIANPPSFAHVHCAQALGIPVHMMFTMPWTSTKAFPHPLANLKNNSGNDAFANYISYGVVDWLTWQGLGDVVNQWRSTLDLEEVAMFDGPNLATALRVPFTYCWSPALVPKPSDWPSYIDVCGFFFRDHPNYEPAPELWSFIKSGPPPVYVGFGSIVLENPERITAAIMEAVEVNGFRAVVSKGWSNLGSNGESHKDVIFIGDCPHEWLFQHVAAVVHHGGAGTTACGLRNGRPTIIVPFFGDQPFWGEMCAAAGAGPMPIPQKEFTADSLSQAIRYCLSDDAARAAADIAQKMQAEVGVEAAVKSFHQNLPIKQMPCDLIPHLPASFYFKKGKETVKLSSLATELMFSKHPRDVKHLALYQSKSIRIEHSRWDPISGGASSVLGTATDLGTSVTGIFTKPYTEYKDDRDRRAYEESNMEVLKSTHSEAKAKQEGRSDSDTSTVLSTTKRKPISAGQLAGASGMSIAMFAPKALKGMTADIPLALTEGLKNLPRAYGDTVRDHGPVTDFKSGATVAGKTFAWGFIDGISDIIVKPYQGAQKEGVKGAAKGFGKGFMNMTTKTGAGIFGLMGYTSTGIAKSLRAAIYTKTRKIIADARYAEGRWLVEQGRYGAEERSSIASRFEKLSKNKA